MRVMLMAILAFSWLASTAVFAKEHKSGFCKGDECTTNTVDFDKKLSTGAERQIFHSDCLINYTTKAKFERCTIKKGLRPYKPIKIAKPTMRYTPKNYIYGLGGAGLQNELGTYKSGDTVEIKQRIGPVYGAGYDRLFDFMDYDFVAGFQVQTNVTGINIQRQFTGLFKLGFGF